MAMLEGKIKSLGDPVEKYATQLAGTADGETPIKHPLIMPSSIDYFHFKGSPKRTDMYWDLMLHGHYLDRRRRFGGTLVQTRY